MTSGIQNFQNVDNWLSIFSKNSNQIRPLPKCKSKTAKLLQENMGDNQDGGVGRHTASPCTTRTDRKSNAKEVQHQGNKK